MVPGSSTILAQLRRGSVEYCVLALLQGGPAYGLDIGARLGRDGVLMNGDGTLYPLLSRLRKQGLVETHWQESPSGPPRRYYALTDDGRAQLAEFHQVWHVFRDAVDDTLEGRTHD